MDQVDGFSSNFAAQETPSKPSKNWNYLEIFFHPKLRLTIFTFSIVKLYLYMAFFGCLFALSSLGGSIYANSIIAAFAEALGYSLSCKDLKKTKIITST